MNLNELPQILLPIISIALALLIFYIAKKFIKKGKLLFTFVCLTILMLGVILNVKSPSEENRKKLATRLAHLEGPSLEVKSLLALDNSQEELFMYKFRDSLIIDSINKNFNNQISQLINQVKANELFAEKYQNHLDNMPTQLFARNLQKKEDLQEKFEKEFPELATSEWGATEVLNENGVAIEYILLPIWFSETFIIDHQHSTLFKNQKNALLLLDSLKILYTSLEDSILILKKQNLIVYDKGFSDAYMHFEELNSKHLNALEKSDGG